MTSIEPTAKDTDTPALRPTRLLLATAALVTLSACAVSAPPGHILPAAEMLPSNPAMLAQCRAAGRALDDARASKKAVTPGSEEAKRQDWSLAWQDYSVTECLADAHRRIGNNDHAIKLYNSIPTKTATLTQLGWDPSLAAAANTRATMATAASLTQQRRFPQAERVLDTVARQNPDNAEAVYLRAEVYRQTGRCAAALDGFRYAATLSPEYADELRRRATVESVTCIDRTAALPAVHRKEIDGVSARPTAYSSDTTLMPLDAIAHEADLARTATPSAAPAPSAVPSAPPVKTPTAKTGGPLDPRTAKVQPVPPARAPGRPLDLLQRR